MVAQVAQWQPSCLEQLLRDTALMVPLHITPEMKQEAEEEMGPRGVELTPQA